MFEVGSPEVNGIDLYEYLEQNNVKTDIRMKNKSQPNL